MACLSNFVDVFIVGKCKFFKNVWDQAYVVVIVILPHYCLNLDFDPLFHYLDTVSLYVCVN